MVQIKKGIFVLVNKKTTMKKITFMAYAALLTGMTSCSTNNNSPQNIDIDGEWKVLTIAGDTIPETMEGATITFNINDSTYSGVTGVNFINGSFQLEDNALTIGEGAMTRKMGDSISNDVEMKYVQAIHATKTVKEEDGRLLLLDDKGQNVMELGK